MKKILSTVITFLLTFTLIGCVATQPETYTIEDIENDIDIVYATGDDASHITQNILLPHTSSFYTNSVITWESSLPEVISNRGQVVQGNLDYDVILTYTISYAGETLIGTFDVTVLQYIATIDDIEEALHIGYAAGDDATHVTKDLILPSTSNLSPEATISWGSSNREIINSNGEVFRTTEDEFITLTYTISYQNEYRSASIGLTVLAESTTYTVTFNTYGRADIDDVVVVSGTSVERPTDPANDGKYRFVNWFTDSSLDFVYDFDTPVTEDLMLHAGWTYEEVYYNVSFETNGGTSVDAFMITEGSSISNLPTPTRDGYMFMGWYTDEALNMAYQTGTPVTSDLALYARWETEVYYTVIFDTSGGSPIANASVLGYTTVNQPSSPTKEGYTFSGWYIDQTYQNRYTFTDPVTEDLTLYAQWDKENNGGIFSTTDPYYLSLDGLSGTALADALYTLLNDTGTYSTTTYGDARYYLEEADALTGNSSYLNLIYSETRKNGLYALSEWDGGATWNREHVWAKSLLGDGYDVNNSDRGIAADLHNLRAADTNINSERGNLLFSTLMSMVSFGDDGYGRWYPGDDYIGDVARIIFYMDIRWGYETSISSIGTLSTFIEWVSSDPVDAFEENRNDVIYAYQHNRNPFIDYPELVDLIYG